MKKVIPGLICLLLISSCGFEIPQSITIKGEPALYVPLGNPFTGEKFKGKTPEELIDPEYIKTMIETSANEVKGVYEVSTAIGGIDPNALTYLVEYQLADKKLNLQEQMDEAMAAINSEGVRIQDVPSSSLPVSSTNPYYIDENGNPSISESSPFLRIPLPDMVKFVKQVTRTPGQSFGLKIVNNSNINDLKNNLRLKIPALEIGYDTEGTLDSDGNLQFVNTASGNPIFYPRDRLTSSGELLIYARITGICQGIIEPAIVFEWDTAIIDTSEDNPIHVPFRKGDNNNLFRGAASFKQVLGYVYIYGMKSNDRINMTVTFNGDTSTRTLYFIDEPPNFKAGDLLPSSFEQVNDPLNMTDFFNNKEDKELGVYINIPEMHITKDEHLDQTIQCKLCVLIPLDLKISEINGGAPDKVIDGVNIRQNYVPLYLDENDKYNFGDGDLFGRNEGDNIIEITSVDILLHHVNITIMDRTRLAVLIESNRDYRLLKFDEPNASITFTRTSLEKPFNPGFTILLKKDTPGGDYGSFKIKKDKDRKFNFMLDVTAKTRLKYTMDL